MRTLSSAVAVALLAALIGCRGFERAEVGASTDAAAAAVEAATEAALDTEDADTQDTAPVADAQPCPHVAVTPVVGDAACHEIRASDYDQSCTTNADCIEVGQGDPCSGSCAFACASAAINRRAFGCYQVDVANAGMNFTGTVTCNCPADFGACCRGGRCVDDSCCLNPCPANSNR